MAEELEEDEIAAYTYAKRIKTIEEKVIKAFVDGCKHKDTTPMHERMSSIINSFGEVLHSNKQARGIRDYRLKDLENEQRHLNEINQDLLFLKEKLKKYE